MGNYITCLVLAALFSATAAPVFAQGEFVKDNVTRMIQKVGVHVGVGLSEPLDSDVTKGTRVGVSVGMAPGRDNGWKYPIGLTWFSEELRGPGGAQFGVLQTRAALAGIGYGWHFGKLSTTLSLQGGIALNKVRLDDAIALREFDTPGPVKVRLHNAAVVRPQLRFEYFLTDKVTVRTALSYVYMQPNIEVQTLNGRVPGSWNAQNINLSIGLGYYPFRK
jgi:hypothetical protein